MLLKAIRYKPAHTFPLGSECVSFVSLGSEFVKLVKRSRLDKWVASYNKEM